MIDDDEVLESAQETGYRLCACSSSIATTETFEVHNAVWDPCHKNRLYICMKSGVLRVYFMDVKDFETNSYVQRDYRVLFREFASNAAHLKTGKPITLAWDKILAIPGRPDEVLFTIGVSRNLMYSALPGDNPYPETPYISQTTRSDFSGKEFDF